jgi:ferredoxin
MSTPDQEARFDRREALWLSSRLAVGGVLGTLLAAAGCRATPAVRGFPDGSPTAYYVDPALCTHCQDCLRVCRCDAIGFDASASHGANEPECTVCFINEDKCCVCGRCYVVCNPGAIIACYGEDKMPGKRPEPKPCKCG